MLDLRFSSLLRLIEIQLVARFLPPCGKILEIGAGTGTQALWLYRRGFNVVAIDIPSSAYRQHRVYPVIDYDGVHIPLPSASIDVVFSSNVLEHVKCLPALLADCARVLKPQGYMVHVLPTPAWRWWSLVSGIPDLPIALLSWDVMRGDRLRYLKIVGGHIVPVRHGASGTAFSELWTFSRQYWRHVFRCHGWQVVAVKPMGIFYTGWKLLGTKLSFAARRQLAHAFGSACNLYIIRRNTHE